jgi:rhodanese-related sulfurtransferase
VRAQQNQAVSPTEAMDLITAGAVLVDVREDHEWAAGHAPQATHLAMSRLGAAPVDLPTDATIVCVCHLGGRSAAVAQALNGAGWTAVNLTGGMEAWQSAGLPVVTDTGDTGTVV